MNWEAFFQLHSDLPREGPGLPEDVTWAMAIAKTGPGARILDAGCGPGADIPALLSAGPGTTVLACDTHAPFAEAAQAQFGSSEVRAEARSMLDVEGPFDLIWCAGAIYFTGIAQSLEVWRKTLSPGGHVAFTFPCYFTDSPSAAAEAFWGDEPGLTLTVDQIKDQVASAGYGYLDGRPLSDAAWEAYYQPMENRIAELRPGASPELAAVLDDGRAEIEGWRALRQETGYWLTVVRPQL